VTPTYTNSGTQKKALARKGNVRGSASRRRDGVSFRGGRGGRTGDTTEKIQATVGWGTQKDGQSLPFQNEKKGEEKLEGLAEKRRLEENQSNTGAQINHLKKKFGRKKQQSTERKKGRLNKRARCGVRNREISHKCM